MVCGATDAEIKRHTVDNEKLVSSLTHFSTCTTFTDFFCFLSKLSALFYVRKSC
jgi:hypothetical protein